MVVHTQIHVRYLTIPCQKWGKFSLYLVLRNMVTVFHAVELRLNVRYPTTVQYTNSTSPLLSFPPMGLLFHSSALALGSL